MFGSYKTVKYILLKDYIHNCLERTSNSGIPRKSAFGNTNCYINIFLVVICKRKRHGGGQEI